ncbi:MAG: hypothetical protein MUC56_18200 [Thermoanaerobaculales bacterium]|nr:hypothetical protein [Thermoanaerobaculales bacterium]
MRSVVLAAVTVACIAPPLDAVVPSYRVQFLGAGFTATGLNEHGVVCGSVTVGTPETDLLAAVSHDGQPYEILPLPPGMQSSRAHDVNNAGVIVGSVSPTAYVTTQPIAAVWRPVAGGYEVEVLGSLPGDPYSAAIAVNDLGDIVGGSGFWGWNLSTGVLFAPGGPSPLPDGMSGVDVNNGRVVLTGSRLLDLDTGEITEVPLPPGTWQGFVGAALNNAGDFAGYILGYSGCSTFPMRFRQAAGWEYLGGCATTTSATAINDRGDSLLYYYSTTTGAHFVDEGYYPLGALIDPSQGGWTIQPGGANGINNVRQIIAAARQGLSGPIGAILMTPLDGGPLFEDGFESGGTGHWSTWVP